MRARKGEMAHRLRVIRPILDGLETTLGTVSA
uniref:Uncharacterized protein n=1 Tax=Ralstonia solanacearum TaxID=305 RepID=A0A0S4TMF1_RALSL|nr:protein of unknown function [Ralstonia solanacearum]